MRLTKKRADNVRYYLSGLAEVSNSYPKGYGRIQVGHAVDKLAEYEDLEEQNRLLKLPCAVGDTVYRVHKGTKLSPDRTYECRVVGVKQEYNTFSVKLYANINEETYSIWIDDWFDRCQIGYEFFLTREESEAALKDLERGKGE